MLFLKFSNANMSFSEETLIWRTYTTNEALPTIEQVQFINKKDFVKTALDVDSETFIVYKAIRKQEEMPVYSKRQA